jgi:exodeoxyribonuclease-3
VTDVQRNLGDGDDQARLIAGTVEGVRVVCLYAPNGQSITSPAYQYKLEWYAKLHRWLAQLRGQSLVVCGDFNVAPSPIDTWDPRLWEGQTLFTPRERAALQLLVDDLGLIDLLRARAPAEEGLFTWWDYRAGAFRKNQGLRIDHLLVDASMQRRCSSARVDRAAREGSQPSDHAPVEAIFD